jgi:hypothetical protein
VTTFSRLSAISLLTFASSAIDALYCSAKDAPSTAKRLERNQFLRWCPSGSGLELMEVNQERAQLTAPV